MSLNKCGAAHRVIGEVESVSVLVAVTELLLEDAAGGAVGTAGSGQAAVESPIKWMVRLCHVEGGRGTPKSESSVQSCKSFVGLVRTMFLQFNSPVRLWRRVMPLAVERLESSRSARKNLGSQKRRTGKRVWRAQFWYAALRVSTGEWPAR